jgi:hypothetical protein
LHHRDAIFIEQRKALERFWLVERLLIQETTTVAAATTTTTTTTAKPFVFGEQYGVERISKGTQKAEPRTTEDNEHHHNTVESHRSRETAWVRRRKRR